MSVERGAAVAETIEDLWREVEELQAALRQVKNRSVGMDFVGCRVIQTTSQNINSTTFTPLTFQTLIYQVGACWSAGAPTKLYAPVTGYYLAGGSWTLDQYQNTGGRMWVSIQHNGGNYMQSGEVHTITGKPITVSVATGMIKLTAGDYIEVVAYHDMGGLRTTQAASTANQHECDGWLVKVE